jgi:hypothetical protein
VLVQVNRVLPGDDIGDGGPLGTLLNLFLGHFCGWAIAEQGY